MKIFFRRIHLYLSLCAGLVILTACLTGAILVFEKDLQMALNHNRYYVDPQGSMLTADELVTRTLKQFPESKLNGIKIYSDPERSAEISINQQKQSGETVGSTKEKPPGSGKQERIAGFTIFINPYNGEVLEKYSYRETSFYTVFAIHRWLLGGEGSIGKYIVGISTFIFLFIMITGIILWWPKTRKVLQQRLRIKWTAGWKRLNHDLHIVFGFYSAIFLFIFAFTGLAWSFKWFNKGIYTVTGSPMKNPAPPKSKLTAGAVTISFEQALSVAKTVNADASYYSLSKPKDSLDILQVMVLPKDAAHESATNAIYIDQYSGQQVGKLDFRDRSLGAQVRSTFKPVHTGSIWGTPSKIIAFIACLFGVSFPITGTIMWINRTRKKSKLEIRKEKLESVE